RWHGIGWGGYSLDLAIALVIAEEEDLVLPDGSAEGAAKLVLVVRAPKRIKETPCIQVSIPQKLEHITVEMVRPRLGNDFDLTSPVVAVLRVIVIGQYSEFRD